MQQTLNPLFDGDRITSTKTRYKNSMSVQTISNIAKTSFGPKGLDKMLVDESGNITVTNDGATIFRLLDISDPSAKLLASISKSQDNSAGDGTTSVAIVAGELIRLGIEKIQEGLHPSIISSGYTKAFQEAINFIKNHLSISESEYSQILKENNIEKRTILADSIATSLNSKIIGTYNDVFSPIVAQAVSSLVSLKSSKNLNELGQEESVDMIQILMRLGDSVDDSELLDGYCLHSVPVNEQLFELNPIIDSKVVLINFDFSPMRFGMGIKYNLEDVSTIDKVKERETSIPLETLKYLKNQGITGIITSKSFDPDSVHLMESLGMFGIKRVEYHHLNKLASIFNCRIFGKMDTIKETDFNFDYGRTPTDLKTVEKNFATLRVEQKIMDDGSILMIRDCDNLVKSILIRGPNEYVLSEVERSVHDALNVGLKVSKISQEKLNKEGSQVVAGGGSVEVATASYLDSLAETYSSKIKIPIQIFGEALMSIPETLAVNASLEVSSVLSELKLIFEQNIRRSNIHGNEKIEKKFFGVGTSKEKPIVENMIALGVLEPLESKIKILELATEAAISILRVDESIELYPKKVPKKKGC